MSLFHEIIKKIGEEEKIKVTFLSDDWTIVLEKDNKIRYITSYQFDLNHHAIGNIMDDKGLFWDLLKYQNIPVIEQNIIFHNYDKNVVKKYFKEHNQEIVIKGNIGNAGKEVFLVNNEENLFQVIDELLLKEYSVSLCPYYNIKNEYRVVILDNTVRVIFGKIKPKIIGDGKKTIKELAMEYSDYYVRHEDKINNPDHVLKSGEEMELSFKFNLSSGAKTFTSIPEDLKCKIMDLALLVTKKLHITFASVDIIHTLDNRLLVLEANSGVTLNNFILQNENGYNIAYNIYLDAIKLMFEKQE